ncbi:MAG: c-type cytochrome [Pseudomonadota bacterium]|nr:c-type cytochrome [Pseudomonadota bacterium]
MRRIALIAALIASSVSAEDSYYTLDGHGGPVMSVTVSPDGQIATASFDNAVGLWSNQEPHWFDGHEAAVNTVAFVNENTLVSASDDFTVIMWNLTDGSKTVRQGHKGKVMSLAVSPDRTLVASASWDGTIGLWPLDGSAPSFLTDHDGPVNDVAFSADGTRLYSASADGSLRVWDVAGKAEITRLVDHGFGLNEIALAANDAWLAYGAVDGVTRIISPDTGEALRDLSADRRPILALEATKTTDKIAVGDGEGYIMVVDTADWRIIQDFRATTHGPIWGLAFSTDGTSILATGLDDKVHSWPIAAINEAAPMDTANRSFLTDPDAVPNGERQFKRKCSVCHTLTPGSARRAGPTLYGLFGRQAGTVQDYTYSDALNGSDVIWNEDTIDALFDIGPEHYVPGTKMPMQRITGAEDRSDLIAYLRRETAPEETQK